MANNDRIALRLHEEEDKDIIEFLEGKAVTYVVKLALRRFMHQAKDLLDEKGTIPVVSSGGKESESADDLLEF